MKTTPVEFYQSTLVNSQTMNNLSALMPVKDIVTRVFSMQENVFVATINPIKRW